MAAISGVGVVSPRLFSKEFLGFLFWNKARTRAATGLPWSLASGARDGYNSRTRTDQRHPRRAAP
jgi:hypothetical protein